MVLLACVCNPPLLAHHDVVGVPPFQFFEPSISAFPQNFAILQGADEVVYLGNAEGVLAFDGERWELLRLPNRELVRALANGPDGRVLVGGYNSFGYLERSATGELAYHELSGGLQERLGGREFADIWGIAVAPEGIYFRALNDVFRWQPETGEIEHWHHVGRFGALRHLGGRTLLQFREQGLSEWRDGGWQHLPHTQALSVLLYDLLPLPDQGILAHGRDGVWWRLQGEQLQPLTMPAEIADASEFEHVQVLSDGGLAVASRGGELFLLNSDFSHMRRVRLARSFLSDIALARDGGLLVSGNRGFFHLVWPGAWTLAELDAPLAGGFVRVVEHAGELALAARTGLTAFAQAGSGRPAPTWQRSSLFDLLDLDDGTTLIAHAHALKRVGQNEPLQIGDDRVYPRRLKRSEQWPEDVLVGTEFGLRRLSLDANASQLSPSPHPELAVRVTEWVELTDGSVLAASGRHGVWRYRWDAAQDRFQGERIDPQLGIDTAEQGQTWISQAPDGEVLISTLAGIWRWQDGAAERQDFHGLAAHIEPNRLLRLEFAPDGTPWAWDHGRLLQLRAGAWFEHPVRDFLGGAIVSLNYAEDGRLLLVSDEAVLVFDPNQMPPAVQPGQVRMRRVARWHEGEDAELWPLPPGVAPEVVEGDFAIGFGFSLMDLRNRNQTQYSGRLVGHEASFSEWLRAHHYTYWSLPAGEYQLEVRARDGYGRITSIPPYPIHIRPAWYNTWWSRALGAALILLAVIALTQRIVRLRTERVVRQRQQMESTINERTRALAEANRRLDSMAHLDGLTGVANRRRLDEYLEQQWQHCLQEGCPLAILAIDVDRFKDYNDQHGHLAGDELLKQLTRVLSEAMRHRGDLLARFGGEEFMIAMPGATESEAAGAAQRLRQRIADADLGSTISIGVRSTVPTPDSSLTDLMGQADLALYRAKQAGRNRVEVGL